MWTFLRNRNLVLVLLLNTFKKWLLPKCSLQNKKKHYQIIKLHTVNDKITVVRRSREIPLPSSVAEQSSLYFWFQLGTWPPLRDPHRLICLAPSPPRQQREQCWTHLPHLKWEGVFPKCLYEYLLSCGLVGTLCAALEMEILHCFWKGAGKERWVAYLC